MRSAPVATPTSPIPAARASGAMLSDGIAVITGLVAMADNENRETASAAKRIFFIVVFVYCVINLLNDLFDFYIVYDEYSNTLFLSKLTQFKQMEFFFGKVQNKLQTLNNINFDIITEIISKDNTSYSTGSSIYIDRTLNKIFQKNSYVAFLSLFDIHILTQEKRKVKS